MNAKSVFTSFADLLKVKCSDTNPVVNVEEDVKSFEVFYPEILKVLQKDESIFSVERRIFGVNVSDAWKAEGDKTELWKQLHTCLLASFLQGDIKEKITPLVNMFKSYWAGTGSGAGNDEINKILNDSESENKFKDILTFITETRIAKLFMSIIEQLDITEIGLNFEKPEELIEIIKNPEHPVSAKIIARIQNIIKGKVQRGEITQRQIEAEIEQIKLKIASIFGDMFKDALGLGGGAGAEVPPTVLMGNSPEARRQRMIARLQKKQREKTSQ
jgi:hypothetical protein